MSPTPTLPWPRTATAIGQALSGTVCLSTSEGTRELVSSSPNLNHGSFRTFPSSLTTRQQHHCSDRASAATKCPHNLIIISTILYLIFVIRSPVKKLHNLLDPSEINLSIYDLSLWEDAQKVSSLQEEKLSRDCILATPMRRATLPTVRNICKKRKLDFKRKK